MQYRNHSFAEIKKACFRLDKAEFGNLEKAHAFLQKEGTNRETRAHQLNTAFIERLNLTIRQGSAYLGRRSPCHARSRQHLDDHLELLRCYYNFVRPHMALKFGKQMLTPAMQARLVSKRLTFREIFTAVAALLLCVVILLGLERQRDDETALPMAA